MADTANKFSSNTTQSGIGQAHTHTVRASKIYIVQKHTIFRIKTDKNNRSGAIVVAAVLRLP